MRRGIEALSRHQTDRTSLAQRDKERRSTKPEVARSSRARGANTGVWQRGRLRLPVKQSPTRTRWFAQCAQRTGRAAGAGRRPSEASNPSAPTRHDRASSTGRAAASKAEGSRFDSVVRCQTSRRSQVVEGIWLQTRRRKPASVRIGSSSPGLISSVDESSRLLPGGSAVRIGHEVPNHLPGSAVGRAPGC